MTKQDDGKLRCPRCGQRFYGDQLVPCDEENTGSYIWLCFKCFKCFKPRGRRVSAQKN